MPDPTNPGTAPFRRELRRHGSYFAADKDGFVVKTVSLSSLQPGWRNAVEEVVQACRAHFGSALHSVYVRGSVAKGLAIDHLSDLDCIAAVHTLIPLHRLSVPWTGELCRNVAVRYPFMTACELMAGSVEQARLARRAQILFQTQTLCVHGRDLADEFARAQVGRDASTAFRTLPAELDEALRILDGAASGQTTKTHCGWIMRNVLRTAFELVMGRERRYTRDLYLCYESFAAHYPERSREMLEILELAINPTADPRRVMALLGGLHWMRAEINRVLGPCDD